MKIRLYSILDAKMGIFLAPFCARNDVDASRQISAALADPQMAATPMAQNPADFSLTCVGEFDDDTGIVSSITAAGDSGYAVRLDVLRPGTVPS